MTRGYRGRLLAALFSFALLAAPAEAQSPSVVARDAVGILVDNQDRCLELSYGRLDILQADYTRDEQTEEMQHYLEAQNGTNVRVARNALGVARRLTRDAGRGGEDPVKRSLADMLGSQEDLCEWATSAHSLNDAEVYRRQIREQGDQFAQAQAALPMDLQLTRSQRREVVQKYRDQLYGGRDGFADGATSGVASDPISGFDGPISEQEYQRKKKAYDEWLAEQERREAEMVRRQAERRAAMQERLSQQPREMPKLELNVPRESEQAVIDPQAMAAWHGEYATRIAPFKRSLSGFLKSRSTSRTLIMFNACLDLARGAQGVLEDPKALESPDPQVGQSLKRAVGFFKQAADACVNNRLKASRDAVTRGERALGEAAKALKPHGLGL